MRTFVFILSGSLAFCGCVSSSGDAVQNTPDKTETMVRLANSTPGRVAKVNPKFAVLSFPFGGMPVPGQQLNVYRDEKKVAELRVTGPQRDHNTVADILSGEVEVNDEVRRD